MATHPARRGWSYAEFARLPDDGNRYEIIAGDLFMTPSPRPIHQRVGFKLGAILEAFVSEHALGWVMTGPVDVLFGEDDYLAPDLVFVRPERRPFITERGVEAAPDLVVEVLSPSTALRDRGIKRERYAFFGVPEYWVVDADAMRVEVYHLLDDPDRPALVATDRFEWRPVEGGPALTLGLDEFMRGFD
ncbi:MAG TPA: Uma2 family endonuclease [Longimicrobium sp.]|nr:Uma2 family endonuclease [Longimicrobium sp.]